MIKSIEIENVRGIQKAKFIFREPDMHPNKVHLLIASNGFGKSSFATAFSKLNSQRLSLKEKDCHRHSETNRPELTLVVQEGESEVTLRANQTKNEIGKKFDVFVISGPRKVKASQRQTETGFQIPVAEFVIEPIEICKIPQKAEIAYKYRESAAALGGSGKAAPNIENDLKSPQVLTSFLNSKFSSKEIGAKLKSKLDLLLNKLRSLSGRTEDIKTQISDSIWTDVSGMPELVKMCEDLTCYDSNTDKLLASVQLISACRHDLALTKMARKWHDYKERYERVKEMLEACNPRRDWINIDIKQTHQTLVVALPKPETMSNGQRDLLYFLTQLLEFEFKANKEKTILVIDEVFDYLDYANVIVCQYYLKKFIDLHVIKQWHIYPIILTHLDPSVFNSYVFSKKVQKNHYLDRVGEGDRNTGLGKIIKLRGTDRELEDVFAKHHAHHSLEECDQKEMFNKKGLKTNWGCSATFKRYCREQVEHYLSGTTSGIDFLAVCLGLRIHIEKCACDQLEPAQQSEFTSTPKTIAKLDYAVEHGSVVPEHHYLLAGLYNSALHATTSNDDFITPVVSKLQNNCIREIVRSVFN